MLHLAKTWSGEEFQLNDEDKVNVLINNWRGEVVWRTVIPLPVKPFKASDIHEYHPGKWCVRVWDVDRKEERTYPIANIMRWLDPTPPPTDITDQLTITISPRN